MTTIHCDPTRRHDCLFLFDVLDSNPNGDPDGGNQPRMDSETMQGLVSDGCLKRKVRNFIDLNYGEDPGMGIYIRSRDVGLNALHARAHEEIVSIDGDQYGVRHQSAPSSKAKRNRKNEEQVDEKREEKEREAKESQGERQRMRRDWLRRQFYDIRTFGGVMTTGEYPSGQIHGPVQFSLARSIDAISPIDLAITRVAVAEADPTKKTTSTMGRKWIVPYGLYRGYVFVTPAYARQSGFSEHDLTRFWEALLEMWRYDRSAARPFMELKDVYIFSHDSGRGNGPAYKLFERITVKKKEEVTIPRSYSHYDVTVNAESLPEGVTLTWLNQETGKLEVYQGQKELVTAKALSG